MKYGEPLKEYLLSKFETYKEASLDDGLYFFGFANSSIISETFLDELLTGFVRPNNIGVLSVIQQPTKSNEYFFGPFIPVNKDDVEEMSNFLSDLHRNVMASSLDVGKSGKLYHEKFDNALIISAPYENRVAENLENQIKLPYDVFVSNVLQSVVSDYLIKLD